MNEDERKRASEPVTMEIETTRFGYLLLSLAVDEFEVSHPFHRAKRDLQSAVENSADAGTQEMANIFLSSMSSLDDPADVPAVLQEEA